MKETIRLTSNNLIEVREVIDGQFYRRVLHPADDVSSESQMIKDFYAEKIDKKIKDDRKIIDDKIKASR